MDTTNKKKWDTDIMSAADYAKTLQYQKVFDQAGANYQQAVQQGDEAAAAQYRQIMENAHLQTEQLRAQYGYSGGGDGSQYIPLNTTKQNLSTQVQDNSSYLQAMYDAKKQAALAELKQAYEANVNAMDRAQAGLEKTYQTARNQTAGTAAKEERNFAEYANASGLNNGTAGQAKLARSVTLQNNLNAINTERASALADLRLQRANAETEYNSAIAQAEAQQDYELAAALYKEKVRVQDALMDAEIQQRQDDLKAYQLQYQAGRDAVEDSQWQQELNFKLQQYADQQKQAAEKLKLEEEQAKQKAEQAKQEESDDEPAKEDYEGLFAAAQASGYPRSYIANHFEQFGFAKSTGLYNEYEGWLAKNTDPAPYVPPADPVEKDTSLGRGYWDIVNELAALEGARGDISERVLKIIIAGVKSGQLTQAGEEKLLEQYGL